LIAHGRGEALDYLLGERTHAFAMRAIEAASAMLIIANCPIVTVNGNVAALAGHELAALARNHPALGFEVNLFHYTPERAQRIARALRDLGLTRIIEFGESDSPITLGGIDSSRRFMHPEGVGRADVVLVALEDGDRCGALVASGRKVIAIDLNPLSRTAQLAHVSVIDELTRTVDALDRQLSSDRSLPRPVLAERLATYDNQTALLEAVSTLRTGFASKPGNEPAREPRA
jgi:4-phosphopantoate--beta-alanine ligase